MNTNEKGHVGLMRVLNQFASEKYECFLPIHDYSAVDLIVINSDGLPKRLQIKYLTPVDGKISIPLCSVCNRKKIPINKNMIDGWGIYIAKIDICIFVPITVRGIENSNMISIRTKPTKERKTRAQFYIDFMNINVFWESKP